MKLKSNNGEKPLWSQLYDILEERILKGEYPVGSNLPTEVSLMEEFGVSRITVRQAMDKLIESEFITRKRGKGTIVLERKNKIETSFVSSFNGIHEKNNDTDRRVISIEYEAAPVEVAYHFGINKNEKVLKLTRGIYIDNQMVSIQETYLNPQLPINEKMDYTGSLYKMLEGWGYKITGVSEEISASIISSKEKKLFNISKNEAIMTRVRKAFSDGFPIEITYSRYLSKGYKLIIELN